MYNNCWLQCWGSDLTFVQARLKPGTVLTGTSEAPPIRSVVLRAVARGRKIVGRWGWCCNLSEVVLGKQ